MKTSAICLLLIAGFAAQASAVTIGEAVAGLCPDAKARLEQNAVLNLAIAAAKDVEIEIPAGENVVVVAPSDDAFTAALAKLQLAPTDLLASGDLLKSVLALHIAASADAASDMGTTVAGSELMFMENGEPVSLADFLEAPPADLTIMEGDNTAAVEEVIGCDAGATVVFVDTVLLPAAAPSNAPAAAPSNAPAAAPSPAPSAPMTIGGLVNAVCPGILAVLQGPEYSTLLGLLSKKEIADTVITLPKGDVIIAAPTNAALATFIEAAGAAASNNTIIYQVLANHIATAPSASDSTATALSGQTMAFWTKASDADPKPAGIAALAAANGDRVITDGDEELANVVAAVSCADENQYAFAIDQVLVPKDLLPEPSPSPPAPSSAGLASGAFAAVAAVAAAMLV